ncbi:MAG: AraC family ligand binding domain-containing protein [Lentisphaeria bacterium]|nr:MAG: AraC family ligand binding domain-containing protein [Lentisphaeria bacterium]
MKTFHLKDFKSGELPIALNIQRWKKDNVSNEHLHDCVEVIYVLSGNGVNFIDSMTFPTIAGDLYVIARGATHSFYSNTELVFYNLMFQPALFGRRELEYFREHPGFRPLFEPPAGSVLNKLSLPPRRANESAPSSTASTPSSPAASPVPRWRPRRTSRC